MKMNPSLRRSKRRELVPNCRSCRQKSVVAALGHVNILALVNSWAPEAVQMPMVLLATASAACMGDGEKYRRAIQLQNSMQP